MATTTSEVSPLLLLVDPITRSTSSSCSSTIHHRHHDHHLLPHLSISYEEQQQQQQQNLSINKHNNNNNNNNDMPSSSNEKNSGATIIETILNLMKTCMGTGCLALPYACQSGGILLYSIGLLFIGAWNTYSVYLLIECLKYIPSSQQRQQQQPEQQQQLMYQTTTSSSSSSSINSLKKDTQQQHQQQSYISSSTLPLLPPPPEGTSTLGIVAWYALDGPKGLYIIDICQILLLIGITVSYISAAISFLNDVTTNFIITTENNYSNKTTMNNNINKYGNDHDNSLLLFNAIVTFIILGSISAWVRDVGALSKASASGLLVLLGTFLVIAAYGIHVRFILDVNNNDTYSYSYDINHDDNDNSTTGSIIANNTNTSFIHNNSNNNNNSMIHIWPASFIGISDWFGIAVFGYGIVPLTYNFQESMQQPNSIVLASTYAMTGVALLYVIVGIGLYILFPNIQGDVLHELPNHGWIPFITRLSMILIVFVTAPLIAVPCAEIIEGKLFGRYYYNQKQQYQHHLHDYDNDQSNHHLSYNMHHRQEKQIQQTIMIQRCFVRFSLIGFSALVAVSLPGFVQVLSLVGCFCVATVGFCIPPLLHLRLVYISAIQQQQQHSESVHISSLSQHNNKLFHPILFTYGFVRDFVLLLFGICATLLSTIYTLRQMQAGDNA